MIGPALDRVFREASGRIVGALASRFRDLDLAEDSFSEACTRAMETWAVEGLPRDPAAWLFQVGVRCAIDTLRRRHTKKRFAHLEDETVAEDPTGAYVEENSGLIPDERLRLIFICCHPSIAVESRSALTLRLVCGLSPMEIARAFLVPEPTLAQRLLRAKRKIADAGIPFEVPGPSAWPERLDAVLSTLEIAYSKAHEDAAGSGPHAAYAKEMLELTRTLAELLPDEAEVLALAALVRFAEARRPTRLDSEGRMVPLSDQDPERWDQPLIKDADEYLTRACRSKPLPPRVLQAAIHGVWCSRKSLAQPAPWPDVLRLYDKLVQLRGDPVVRLNRAVALGEVAGVATALSEVESLEANRLQEFAPYHAVCADLLRKAGRSREALEAYELALSLVTTAAEHRWLQEKRDALLVNPTRTAVP